MKKRILLLLAILTFVCTVMSFSVSANVITPDSNGRYTVEFELEPGNEYVLFVIKGIYDQTDYIEAFNAAGDEDILYFEQRTAGEDGYISFGPFAPMQYCDGTLVLGGTGLSDPVLAGTILSDGISSAAMINIKNVESSYTVNGYFGEDVVIDVETEVFDSFGMPSLSNPEVTLSVSGAEEYVTVDNENGKVTIDRMAPKTTFKITAAAGSATDEVFVSVKRNELKAYRIDITDPETGYVYGDEMEVVFVEGNLPTLSFDTPLVDQFGETSTLNGAFSCTLGGEYCDNYEVTPPAAGTYDFVVNFLSHNISKTLRITFVQRGDYQDEAKELYELVLAAQADINDTLNGVGGKYVSELPGKDVYPDEKWITSDVVTALENAIEAANAALATYGKADEANFVKALSDFEAAYKKYTDAFKAGIRKDAQAVDITSTGLDKVAMSTKPIKLAYKVTPLNSTDILVWESSNPDVISVDSTGALTTKSYGSATITVKTSLGYSDSIDVTVWNYATLLEVTTDINAKYGDPLKSFTAAVYVADPSAAPSGKLEWSVLNPAVAEIMVSEDGLSCTVIPVKAGSTKVTAKIDDLSVTRNVKITMPTDWITPASPTASSESGYIYKGTGVALTCETANTTIYYTLNGEDPNPETARLYKGEPIAINQNLMLKAIAVGEKMFNSPVAVYEYQVINPTVRVNSATVQAGENVVFDVYFEGNPGFDNLAFNLTYDSSALTFVSDTVNTVDGVEIAANHKTGAYSISLSSADASKLEGKLATLVFKVVDNAYEGVYPLGLTVTTESDDEKYDFVTLNGGIITIDNLIIGDADDNGRIEMADVLIIKQYLAGMKDAQRRISLKSADVTANGVVDEEDIKLLSKYCVGWDVTLGA